MSPNLADIANIVNTGPPRPDPVPPRPRRWPKLFGRMKRAAPAPKGPPGRFGYMYDGRPAHYWSDTLVRPRPRYDVPRPGGIGLFPSRIPWFAILQLIGALLGLGLVAIVVLGYLWVLFGLGMFWIAMLNGVVKWLDSYGSSGTRRNRCC